MNISLLLLCCACAQVLAQDTNWEKCARNAEAFVGQGRYADAEREYSRALSEAYRMNVPDLRLVPISKGLASVYSEQARYDDAETLYRRLMTTLEAAFGTGHREVAVVVHDLAVLAYKRGRYPEAETLCRRALTALERSDTPRYAMLCMLTLGEVTSAQGRYSEAEALYRQPLALYQGQLQAGNTAETVMALNSLGRIYLAQQL